MQWVHVDAVGLGIVARLQDLAARCNFELQNYRDAAILYKPLTQSLSPAARRTKHFVRCWRRCSSLHKFQSSLGLERARKRDVSVSPLPVCFAVTGIIRPPFGTWGTICQRRRTV